MAKPTFEEVLAETEDTHRKSDLSNLAHALTLLRRHIKHCQSLEKDVVEMARKLDAEEDVPEGEVHRLYETVRKEAF